MGWLIDLVPLSYTNSVVLIGAVIFGATAGMLGAFAVLRERSLVGDALAHAALPGVAVAFLVTGARDAGTLMVGAAIACAIGALLIIGIERTGRIRPDAAIGVVLASFFALGIVLLTAIQSGADASQAGLETYIFGQAAGLLERDLVVMAALGGAAIVCVAIGYRALKVTLFDRDFAGSAGLPVTALDVAMTLLLVIAVVVGIRTVGAILLVATLIVPTVVARQLTSRLGVLLVLAALTGASVGAAGSLMSASAEVPTGPVIVLTGLAVAVAAILLAPRRGVAWRARRLARDRRRALVEGVLVDLETALHSGPPPTRRELTLAGGRTARQVRRALADLDRAGMLARDGERLVLSESGAAAAHAVLERRDLWGAWLEHGWKLDLPDAREPDPADLRASLGDECADDLIALAANSRAAGSGNDGSQGPEGGPWGGGGA